MKKFYHVSINFLIFSNGKLINKKNEWIIYFKANKSNLENTLKIRFIHTIEIFFQVKLVLFKYFYNHVNCSQIIDSLYCKM